MASIQQPQTLDKPDPRRCSIIRRVE